MKCKYDTYGHKCGNDFVNSEGLCEQHSQDRCWCGEQAVGGCCMELQFICGRPLCKDHLSHCPAHGGEKPPKPRFKLVSDGVEDSETNQTHRIPAGFIDIANQMHFNSIKEKEKAKYWEELWGAFMKELHRQNSYSNGPALSSNQILIMVKEFKEKFKRKARAEG